jgi:hypothetical protein
VNLPSQSGPFLVFPGGDCVPIDGPLHVAELRDGWYVIGQNSTVPCGSEQAAQDTLRHLLRAQDPHDLAAEAVESLKLEVDLPSVSGT